MRKQFMQVNLFPSFWKLEPLNQNCFDRERPQFGVVRLEAYSNFAEFEWSTTEITAWTVAGVTD